jgi:hypothetical protein
MASKLARRSRAVVHRRPSPLLAKLKTKLQAANRRASTARQPKLMADLVTAGGAALLGFAEQKAFVPARIGPVDSALVVGGLGAFVLPRFLGGKVGAIAHDATLGVLCVATYRLGTGSPLMGAGGWEG